MKSSSSKKSSGNHQRVAEMAEAVEVLRLNLMTEPEKPNSIPKAKDGCSFSILE